MSKFEYVISNDGMPPGETHTVEADYYERKLNESSQMYEYIFYLNRKVVLIVPVYLMIGRIRLIG